MDMKDQQYSLIHNSKIPQEEMEKFATTLDFLKQKQLQEFLQQRFIERIKMEAYINGQQLRDLCSVVKVEKQLLHVMKMYFSIAFNHESTMHNRSSEQGINTFNSQQNQKAKQSIGQVDNCTKELYDRLMALSSYENLTVKILIESLLFLKKVFHEQFVHKKLVNEFEKGELVKKLEVWNQQAQKKRGRSLMRRKHKDTIYFKEDSSIKEETSNLQNEQEQERLKQEKEKSTKNNVFSFLKAKIFSIVFLEYEKLESKQVVFRFHLQLLQKCISEREIILNCLIDRVSQKSQDQMQKVFEYQNSTFYFVLNWFQLRIQFEPKNHEYLIIKDLKQKKKDCKKLKQTLQNFRETLEFEKDSNFHHLLHSVKAYLKNLQSLNDQIKQRVAHQLMGPNQGFIASGTVAKSKGDNKPQNIKTNYEKIKQTIYELTLSCLNQGGNRTMARNISNERILQQYIKNNDEIKSRNESLIHNSNHPLKYQEVSNDKANKMSSQQMQKARSLTLVRQNLHKGIFVQQCKSKAKSKVSQSISRRTRSLFNLSKSKKQDQSSIKNLLQSPLNRQIQIYLQYQKFLKNSKQISTKQSNPIQNPTQSRVLFQNAKPINEGFKLIDQINKYSHQDKKPKKLLTNSKKKKIQTIYKAFAYNNKIVDISHWKLEEQINESKNSVFFNKAGVKSELTKPICDFGKNTKNLDAALEQMLAQRCYMRINYVKIWQAKSYFYKIRMSQQSNKFSLYMKMNEHSLNLILPRGDNILCQRYLTIWPTIRYLLQKKMFQFSIIKLFENIFHIKKNTQLNGTAQTPKNSMSENEGLSLIVEAIKSAQRAKLQQFESNQCSVFEATFGKIQSDEAEQINSCFDYIHKFLGLIFSQTKKQNGRKKIVSALQDNGYKKQTSQTEDEWQKKKENLLKCYKKQKLKSLSCKKTAKFWVGLENHEQIHLLSFLKKAKEGLCYLFTVSISKYEISKIMEAFILKSNANKKASQPIQQSDSNQELKLKISWRNIYEVISQSEKSCFTDMRISFKRFETYHLELKYIYDIFILIVAEGLYNSKFIHSFKNLIADSIFIENSVEGDKLYDLAATNSHKIKKIHLNTRKTLSFKDYYKPIQNLYPKKSQSRQGKVDKKYIKSNSHLKLTEISSRKDDQTIQSLIHVGSNKTEIQIIENYMDILAWQNSDNQVRFKPNSKWKIVQTKILTMITFVTHHNKKTQRKSSLLMTQKIRQNHQFIENSSNDLKKRQKVSPLMMKSLPKMKKSTISFLQKIQNELYRIKVNILESSHSINEQNEPSQKWMAEIIMMKESSKQYTKFYISSADIEIVFKDEANEQSPNESMNLSESYEIFTSKKGSEPRLRKRYSQNKYLKEDMMINKIEISEEMLEMESLKFTNKSDSYRSLEKRSEEMQILDEHSSSQKKNKFESWQFTQWSISNMKARHIKDRKVKMFRRIVGMVSFTKIKCFSKIVISKTVDFFDPTIQKFIAAPRNSLQILHQTTQNPEKIFDLKYFSLLENCYQTIICKPIKVLWKNKVDYVIITLFQIQLKSHRLYQFRINLNKNQTYYACELTDNELRQLIDFSENQRSNQRTPIAADNSDKKLLKSSKQLLTSLYKTEGKNNAQSKEKQPGKKRLYRTSLFFKKSSKMLMEDNENSKNSQKKQSLIKRPQSRFSDFLTVGDYSSILPSSQQQVEEKDNKHSNKLIMEMMSKLEEYSKEILENIFKKIQVTQQTSQDSALELLHIEIAQAKFKKELKLRVIERISKDGSSIYLVEINEKSIRQLNEIMIKTSMNNNFDIFKQNIFKNSTGKDLQTNQRTNNVKKEGKNINIEVLSNKSEQVYQTGSRVRGKETQSQNEINKLFSSFYLEQYKSGGYQKIEEMNQEFVVQNIEYEIEKKFGKELLIKFNSKKIKHYAQIFLHYFLKYLNPQPRTVYSRQT